METTAAKEASSYEEVVRTMIHRENEIINHRVSWHMAAQGLLFAALAFAWDKPQAKPLVLLLCALGTGIAVVALFALIAATQAMKRLFEWWEQHKPVNYDGPGVMGLTLPRLRLLRYFGPWVFFPALFIFAWTVVWVIRG